ncbi:MAG TPA: universal stress protein [Solirubrobacterales bacterium]|jgi:nucleotide-binding universal stress UspA family protein|nr:universal stress protein [Solirubrobacterales bacterium]
MFRSILVALDDSPTSQAALDVAIDLAQRLRSRLTVISVSPEIPGYAYRAAIDVQALRAEVESETERILREGVDRVPEDVPVTSVFRHGRAGEEIVAQLEAGGHDLLVSGSRGRGRVASNLLGSVNAHVFFHSHVPMLVIPPREDSD